MEWTALVSLVAVLEYMAFTLWTGFSRQKFGVQAPATTGHPEWERIFRVQQNTLEQLAIFLPALWIFSTFVSATWGPAIGLLFVIGRPIYGLSYAKEPSRRTLGFLLGFFCNVVLVIGGIGGLVARLL